MCNVWAPGVIGQMHIEVQVNELNLRCLVPGRCEYNCATLILSVCQNKLFVSVLVLYHIANT